MLSKSIVSLSMLGLAAAAPAIPADVNPKALELVRRQYPVLPCSHLTGGLHVIAVGGANSDDPKTIGLLGSLSYSILAAIPGSTNVSVPYDKQFISLTPPTLSPTAVPDGMATLKAYTWHYHTSCPNTKIALLGYSSGAVILMNDLCYGGNGVGTDQINPLLAGKYIIGTVVYGDETFTQNQPYNRGTCVGYGGERPRSNPSLCYPFANSMQSYCDLTDPDCCVGSGNNVTVHLTYPAKYDAVATQFIVNAFKASGGA